MEAIPLSAVLARPDVWRGDRFADAALPAVASGFAQLDRELPGGGWPRGALSELLCDGAGHGEIGLLLPALKELCKRDGWLVLIAPPYPIHAGAWAAAGIPLERLLIVEPRERERATQDALWAAEQALSSDAPSAVLCWSMQADTKAVRRLQLAAATSHAASFLMRPQTAARESSAAVLRLRIAAHRDGVNIDILKRRGPPLSAPLHVTLSRPAPWHPQERSTPAQHPSQPPHGHTLARASSAASVARHPSPIR